MWTAPDQPELDVLRVLLVGAVELLLAAARAWAAWPFSSLGTAAIVANGTRPGAACARPRRGGNRRRLTRPGRRPAGRPGTGSTGASAGSSASPPRRSAPRRRGRA